MEPERNIEKELKAYAEKRRADAGTPPELHPANRKLLQEEAARLAKPAGGETRSLWQMISGSWPRIAFTGATIAALVVMTWLLIPGQDIKQEAVRPVLTARRQVETVKESPAASSATLDREKALTPAPGAAPTPVVSNPGPNTGTASTLLGEINSPAPAAATPPQAPSPIAARLAASKQAGSTRPADSVALDSAGRAPQAVLREGEALSLSPRVSGGFVAADTPAVMIVQPFQRTDLPAILVRTAGVAGGSNLLATFRVEQDVEKLRVIDGDGSVYTGFVEQTPEAVKKFGAALQKTRAKQEAEPSTALDKQPQPMQAFRFRVSGTNRTLKEEIVFTGDFLTQATAAAAPAVISSDSTVGAVAPAATPAQPVLLELRKSRLEGRLLLGKTNDIKINAVPAK